MLNTKASTIAELAIAFPTAIPTLERLRIDYCCQGRQPIDRACHGAGITADELMQLIQSDAPSSMTLPAADQSLSDMALSIVKTHHAYTRRALQTMQTLAAKVRDAHGARYPELAKLATLAGELIADLIPHMLKEEQVIFPYVNALQAAQLAGAQPPVPFFGTIKNPIRMMMLEHEVAGEKMEQMRTVSFGFLVPEDGCASYRAFYSLLAEFESDLHRHIHIENNLLFPRAAKMEEEINATAASTVGDCSCSR